MNMNSCRIFLQHEFAQTFFDEAMHPNIEELHRRDLFFTEIEENCPYWNEGTDLVSEIPDIDIASLLYANNGDFEFKVPSFSMQPMIKIESEIYQSACYSIESTLDMAA